MIVSGFTQRTATPTDEDLSDFPGCHAHCFRCRNAKCRHPVDNVTTCAMMACPACGWKFHECKAKEHTLTCREVRVPCINSIYGCPHIIRRANIPTHLPVCPASVVCCSEEWCRWPMHTKEKGVRHSLPKTKTYIDCGQLDVGFAMRDQRMLIDSLKAPSKLKRTLRNRLTQKYPAAPIAIRSSSLDSDNDTSQTVSDDDTDAPWDLTRQHPGLRDSISSHLFNVSKETTETLASALNKASEVLQNHSPVNALNGEPSAISNFTDHATAVSNPSESNEMDQGDRLTSEEREDGLTKSVSPVRSIRNSVSTDRERDKSRSRSVSVLHDMGGSQLHKILGVKLGDEGEDEICLHKVLGVSTGHEIINKYMMKAKSMYTFICSQNFRRDQYKWHFKNVHDDIIAQLGFIEHRCPLAYQGCTFSFRRLVPAQPNTEVYFSWLQESFGLRSLVQPYEASCDEDSLSVRNETGRGLMEDGQQPTVENKNSNVSNSNTGPSISDLANIDKEFDEIKVTVPEFEYVDPQLCTDSPNRLPSMSPSLSSSSHTSSKEVMSVHPVMYTSEDPESKVLLVYNVEEESHSGKSRTSSRFTDLPFEVLIQIAKHLDSFSLRNLSLTSCLLRDVCCSLLDDFGIVLLNWERQKVGDKISWKAPSKRWLFSTSFEPITSWKLNDDHMTIGDHLKVCPFNKDISTHTEFQFVLPH